MGVQSGSGGGGARIERVADAKSVQTQPVRHYPRPRIDAQCSARTREGQLLIIRERQGQGKMRGILCQYRGLGCVGE